MHCTATNTLSYAQPFVLSEEGEVLAASTSVWPCGIPNPLNRFIPNVLGVSALLLDSLVQGLPLL